MTDSKRIEKLIEYAIQKEEQAADFYRDLARRAEKPLLRLVFEQLVHEEVGHKEKLRKVLKGEDFLQAPGAQIESMNIAEKVSPAQPTDEMDYGDAHMLAMRRERESFTFYAELAERAQGDEFRATLLSLAAEEAMHKLKLELEYDHFLFTREAEVSTD